MLPMPWIEGTGCGRQHNGRSDGYGMEAFPTQKITGPENVSSSPVIYLLLFFLSSRSLKQRRSSARAKEEFNFNIHRPEVVVRDR